MYCFWYRSGLFSLSLSLWLWASGVVWMKALFHTFECLCGGGGLAADLKGTEALKNSFHFLLSVNLEQANNNSILLASPKLQWKLKEKQKNWSDMKTRSYRNQKTTAGLQNTGPYTPTVHSFEEKSHSCTSKAAKCATAVNRRSFKRCTCYQKSSDSDAVSPSAKLMFITRVRVALI